MERRAKSRLASYSPYTKQIEFHAAGAATRERLLMAGNQLGKTYCGAAEAAIHLTGLYPDWWTGRRFERPVRAWAGSKTGEVTRDGVQRLLVGEPKDKGQWGTGMIPAERLLAWSARGSTPGGLDGLTVRHVSGGTSTLGFKSKDIGTLAVLNAALAEMKTQITEIRHDVKNLLTGRVRPAGRREPEA